MLFIAVFIPVKGYGVSICNVRNTEMNYIFPYGEIGFMSILFLYHIIVIVVVKSDFLAVIGKNTNVTNSNELLNSIQDTESITFIV